MDKGWENLGRGVGVVKQGSVQELSADVGMYLYKRGGDFRTRTTAVKRLDHEVHKPLPTKPFLTD